MFSKITRIGRGVSGICGSFAVSFQPLKMFVPGAVLIHWKNSAYCISEKLSSEDCLMLVVIKVAFGIGAGRTPIPIIVFGICSTAHPYPASYLGFIQHGAHTQHRIWDMFNSALIHHIVFIDLLNGLAQNL